MSKHESDREILEDIRGRLKVVEDLARELQRRDILRHRLEGVRLLSPDAGSRVLGDVIEQSLRVWDSDMTEDEAHGLIADINDFLKCRAPELSCNLRIFAGGQREVSGWSVETILPGLSYCTLWGNPVVWEYMRECWLEVCLALVKQEGEKGDG